MIIFNQGAISRRGRGREKENQAALGWGAGDKKNRKEVIEHNH